MNKKNLLQLVLLGGFAAAMALWRIGRQAGWLNLPPNFAPIAASAVALGAFGGRSRAVVVPLSAMLISDFFIGFASLPIALSVYGSFAVIGWTSRWLHGHRTLTAVAGFTAAGAIAFFLITNFAVWAWGMMYPPTAAGLLAAYAMGLPFFRWSLASNFLFTAVFFGAAAAGSRGPVWARGLFLKLKPLTGAPAEKPAPYAHAWPAPIDK